MKGKGLIIGAIVLMLGGCGVMDKSEVKTVRSPDGTITTTRTNVNNSDFTDYSEASQEHSMSEQRRISDMAEALMGQDLCKDCSPEGKAYAQSFKAVMLGYGTNFRPSTFNLDKPKTMHDTIGKVVDGTVGILRTGVVAYGAVELGKAIMQGAGDDTDITMGDGGAVDGSFNTKISENHATTGSGNPTATQDNSEGSGSESVGEEEGEGEEGGGEPTGGRCRDNGSCSGTDVCSKQDGTEGVCEPAGGEEPVEGEPVEGDSEELDPDIWMYQGCTVADYYAGKCQTKYTAHKKRYPLTRNE